ncbi:MAG: hypothetical protein CL821_04650 [Crocinitomicaceae bacterium]|nr:hypothetical protein [Crocinitomicaceae bacterium]
MNSERFYLKISIIGIASGIILGAFGAHGLKELFSNYEMDIWDKGIFYQISNFLGLFIMVILKKLNLIKKPPYLLLTLGIIMFSFSLYSIALNNVFLSSNKIIKTLLIPITPVGGLLMVSSWLLLLFKLKI